MAAVLPSMATPSRAAAQAPAPTSSPALAVRAIRGATSVPANTADAILSATRTLLETALRANGLQPADLVSIVFALTPDLDAAFAARAAREAGLVDVPLLDVVSPAVPGSMPRVVRMLLTCATATPRDSIRHIYLGEARALRPDLAGPGPVLEPAPADPPAIPGARPAEEVSLR